nr:MAG TPA: Head protein [Caudoviricetes sp.]
MALTNAQLWDGIRAAFPNFANHTSAATKELFTAAGFEKMQNYNVDTLNEFWDLSMRVFLQTVDIAQAHDPLNDQGFGEVYEQARGGYIQRMAIVPTKPVSPAYRGLKNGSSVDPFKVRKAEIQERFFKQNFDYQCFLTIPDDFQFKQIFISEYGMSKVMAGLMLQLENAYIIQKYVNKLAAINAGINSTKNPLIASQTITAELSDTPTEAELVNLILTIKNTVSAMTVGASSSAFNALQFPTVQKRDRLKLLVRPQFKNELEVIVARNSYNANTLNLPIDIIEVENFGGLEAYKEDAYTTKLYEVYDEFGSVIGYSETEGQIGKEHVEVEEHDVKWKDPNAGVHAILADKGWLFESIQNPYRVEPIRNPRGLYVNYFASAPNNAILIDALYNVVVFKNPD